MKNHAMALSSSIFAAIAFASAASAQVVEVGDQPSYTFRSSLLQGQGAKSLTDFQGKPVLVEFWGTR